MIGTLAFLAALALQDPAPPRTVEQRLKELEEKLSVLEKKQQALAAENAALEKRAADAKAARETWARQGAAGWVKRHAGEAGFTEKQAVELEELWFSWMKEDLEKPADAAKWGSREEALRARLSPEQSGNLARRVRKDQEQAARAAVSAILRTARVAPERTGAFEQAVMGKVSFPEDVLLPQVHSRKGSPWALVLAAVEENLPALVYPLTEEERASLKDCLGRWKPAR